MQKRERSQRTRTWGRRKSNKNLFHFSVDRPNIDALSLLWSPACFALERNSTLVKTASRNLESQDLDHSLTNMPNYSVEKGFKQLGTKIYKCDGLNFFSIKKKNIPQRLERGSANSGAEPLPLDPPLLCMWFIPVCVCKSPWCRTPSSGKNVFTGKEEGWNVLNNAYWK